MPRLIIILVASFLLVGCATYRISSTPNQEFVAAVRVASPDALSNIDVVKLNEFSEGNHCFEPMMYVLSFGIIPTHCVDTYKASLTEIPGQPTYSDTFRVTLMQGWIAFFLWPSPQWKFGFGENMEAEIRNVVADSTDET